ncbi:MAG: TonB family protein [Acidobacteria bacterium]|nr:TonB family protein [Acidobacteriota bacterium]
MSLLLETTIKVSLIVLCVLGATAVLQRQSAAVRHWVLASALVCAAVVPVLGVVVPSWTLPIDMPIPDARGGGARITIGRSSVGEPGAVGAPDVERVPALQGRARARAELPLPRHTAESAGAGAAVAAVASLVLPIWLAGAAMSMAILLVGFARLTWLASRAAPVVEGRWVEIAQEVARAFGIRRKVVILQSAHPTLLVTWGLKRPKIILPAGARRWPDDRIRIVLCHELAHIRRHDWAVQMVAELLRSTYWFNPLLWIASRHLRQESEQTCDDAVLAHGIEGREYAWQLLHLARTFAARGRTWSPAPAIARPSSLERRIGAMLDGRMNRRPMTRLACTVAVLAALAVTLPIAAVQTGPASFSGTVVDPSGVAVPDVRLVLVNMQTNVPHETRTDAAGRFEFPQLPSGAYRLDAWGSDDPPFPMAFVPGRDIRVGPPGNPAQVLPGPRAGLSKLGESVRLAAGERLLRDITLELGPVYVVENVVADATGETVSPRPRNFPETWSCLGEMPGFCGPPSLLDEFERDLQDTGRLPAAVRLPRQMARPATRYPERLRGSPIEGQVRLEGRIGSDGFFADLRVVSASHPDMAEAALEGMRQARWEPGRFRDTPVEVPVQVTVDFSIR